MVFGFGDRPSLRRDIGPEQQSGGREKQKKTWEAEIKGGFFGGGQRRTRGRGGPEDPKNTMRWLVRDGSQEAPRR